MIKQKHSRYNARTRARTHVHLIAI